MREPESACAPVSGQPLDGVDDSPGVNPWGKTPCCSFESIFGGAGWALWGFQFLLGTLFAERRDLATGALCALALHGATPPAAELGLGHSFAILRAPRTGSPPLLCLLMAAHGLGHWLPLLCCPPSWPRVGSCLALPRTFQFGQLVPCHCGGHFGQVLCRPESKNRNPRVTQWGACAQVAA